MDDCKFESIDRWLEGVVEERTSAGKAKQRSATRRSQHPVDTDTDPQESQVGHLQRSNMGAVTRSQAKQAEPPQRSVSSSQKRPATRGKRKAPGSARRVSFSEAGTEAAFSQAAQHSHSTAVSTRIQRDRLQVSDPEVLFSQVDSEDIKPEEICQFFSDLVDNLESAIPSSLR